MTSLESGAIQDSRCRIVILTRDRVEHRFVANQLCARFDISAIILDEYSPSIWRRLRRQPVCSIPSKVTRSVFLSLIRDKARRGKALRNILGQDVPFEDTPRIVRVHGINNRGALQVVGALKPDVLLLYGCAIVGPRMLSFASRCALNLHTGMSPKYRGTHCAFWPIVNGDLNELGATVHECTSDIDGGQIFRTGRVKLQARDGMHECFARCVELGAQLYVEAVQDVLKDRLRGTPQDLTTGVEYRGHMRTIGPEIGACWAVYRGCIRRHVERTATEATDGVTHAVSASPRTR